MKDPKHTPVDSIRGQQLKEAGIPCYPLNDPRPSFPVRGCNNRFGPAANDNKEKPSRA